MSPDVALEPVIGLEIHVQLATRTKLFCGCPLSFAAPINSHTCPVCLGHPGALPTLNGEAVRLAVLAGLALGCEIAPKAVFHRKNYFYPDLPKAYQISQFDEPLSREGRFSVVEDEGVSEIRITRAHLEEDAAKLVHVGDSGRRAGAEATVVDFNRGGTPLVEIVTEPDFRSASAAAEFLRQMRAALRHLGVSDCNMEEGSMRADANVSVRPVGSEVLGTKTELKNMNSFRFLERGMEAEIARQVALVRGGERVVQETLHYDVDSGELHSLRSKEDSHDYRYFPEPDLVPVAPDAGWVDDLRASLPELPGQMRVRWVAELGIGFEDAEVLASSPGLADYFARTAALADPKLAANWIRGELRAQLREHGTEPHESNVTPEAMAELIGLVAARTINQPAAKEVLADLIAGGGSPSEIVAAKGLEQVSDDGELVALVDRIFAENPDQLAQLRAGKDKLVGYFVGQAMKATGGRADPGRVGEIVRERAAE